MLACALCAKQFRWPSHLDYHMVSHTKEKPHKCLICPAAFGRAEDVKKHTKSVHDGIKETRKKSQHCPSCSYKCCTKTKLEIHLRKHSAQLPFSCNIPGCGFKTKYEQNLQRHVLCVHSVDRPYECQYEGCSYKAKTTDRLKKHLDTHNEDKPFTCEVQGCNYTCKLKTYLKEHSDRVHSSEKSFKCSVCDFRTKYSKYLRTHELTHTGIKRFQCQAPYCDYASHQKSKLKVHFDRKHRKKNVICTEPRCNFKCSSISLLKKHLSPMLKCPGDSCNFSTQHKRNLLNHISRKHKDLQSASSASVVGEQKFDLEVVRSSHTGDTLHCRFPNCGYQTKLHQHYERHLTSHGKEGKRKHVCAFCFCRFPTVFALKDHVQRHVGEKPYSCSYCKYTTVDRTELRRHAERVHSIQVIPLGKESDVRKCLTCDKNCFSNSEFVLHSMTHL